MNTQFAFEVIKGLGLSVGIGLAFFIIPFGIIMLSRMLPWFIWGVLFKRDFIRNNSKMSAYPFNNSRYNKQIYINYCHPTQVIKRFKKDGLQSLFRYENFTKTPIHNPNQFGNEQTPVNFLKCANPEPINNKLDDSLDKPFHADNLAQDKDDVNHKQTEP